MFAQISRILFIKLSRIIVAKLMIEGNIYRGTYFIIKQMQYNRKLIRFVQNF